MNNDHHSTAQQSSTRTCTGITFAPAALWASAFVIAALVIVQAGRLPGNQAIAGTASERGSYSALTVNSGQGPETNPNELLFVIDSREQALLVYEIEDAKKKQIILRDGGSLENMFLRARQ